jgi:two-component system, response regulator YesN
LALLPTTPYRQLAESGGRFYYSEQNQGWLTSQMPVSYSQPEAEELEKDKSIALQAFQDGNPLLIDISLNNIKTKACQKRLHPDAVIGACEDMIRRAAARFQLQAPPPQFAACLKRSLCIGETQRLAGTQLKNMLHQTMSFRQEAQEDPEELRTINQYIDDHIIEMVTSIDIANHLHLNSSYFSRMFKKRTGTNFTDYVHQYKMKLAKRFLEHPEETVENVAYSLGYSDRAYFSKVFKKYTGISPSDYKHSR